MAGVAALPMYDLPEIRAATDAWWRGLARALRRQGIADVPARLSHGHAPMELWRSPQLLLAQTCGFPLTHALEGIVQLVATPCYAAPGCRGPEYRSLIVVRADDPVASLAACRGRIAAINGWDSHSGWNVLRAMAAPVAKEASFFGTVTVTGSHAASLAAVRAGRADVAAIDCVTHALLARYRPRAVEGVRPLGWSPAAPGLPYVTHAGRDAGDVARLRAGLLEALADPALAACRDALLLTGAKVLPLLAYHRMTATTGDGAASRP
jgi:ABC-type phosphate/phosphonate transport system substrate-binding protein